MEEECERTPSFGLINYLVCGLMLLVSAGIGVFYAWRARKSTASTDEVLMGGRKMPTFPMSMSLIASFMSAVTLLGNPAEMYNYGTQFVMVGVSYIIVTPITAYLFLPVYYRLGLTSAYEYLNMRFDNKVRQLGCIIFAVHMILYMPIVVYAPALALNQVTSINTYAAVSIIFVVCIFYTSIGGIKAVMWTDTFQVIMMFAGMLAVMIRGTLSLEGGIAEVWQAAADSDRLEFFNMDFDPRTRHTFWTMIVGGSFLWCSTYAANQAQIQRYLTVPSERKAQNALWINCFGLVILLVVCCWSGLVMYAKYATCDPLSANQIKASDQLLPLFVMDTMKDLPGIPGLFVAGIFSGALSTVSTGLSALSAITLRDFISGCCKINLPDERAAKLSKWISVFYGLVSFGLVFVVAQLGAVLQAAMSIHGMVGGPILGLFSLGIFVPWANAKGALSGAITGLVFVFWISIGAQVAMGSGDVHFETKITSIVECVCNATMSPHQPTQYPEFPLYAVSYMWYTPIGWIITMLVGIIVSLMTTPQDPSQLDRLMLSPVTCWVLDHLPATWQRTLQWQAEHKKEDTGDVETTPPIQQVATKMVQMCEMQSK